MELPEGWRIAPLSEVAEVRLGRQRSPKRATGPNMRPYLRAANVGWGELRLDDVKEMDFTDAEYETYCLQPGDILLNEASGSPAEVGKPVIYQGEVPGACFQNTILRVRATSGAVSIPYLFHHLFWDARGQRFADSSRGTNIQHIGRARLASWPTALPPLREQRKIAAILGSVDAAIERTRAVIDQVEVVKKGLMQQLLTRGMPGRHTRFKQTEIGEIPESWEVVRLGDLVSDMQYGTSAKCNTEGTGDPVLRIPNIVRETLARETLKHAALGSADVDRYRLGAGDLLVVRTNGNPAYCGKAWVFPDVPGTWLYASYLIRLVCRPDRLLSPFVYEWLGLHSTRKRMRGSIRTSAGNYNINTKGLGAVLVAVSSLDEQAAILDSARALDHRYEAEASKLAGLQRLKQALMSVLLTGELRVTPEAK